MADAEEIVTTPGQLRACVDELAAHPVLGLDTEFVGESSYHPQLCLIQAAVPGKLFLIDPFTVGSLDSFWSLLHDPERDVVVHAGREEVRICRILSGAPPAKLFDLQIAAGLVGMPYPLGHGGLVQQLLGQRLSKAETLTEWRRRPLTAEQVRYAFDDVRFVLRMHEKLSHKLGKLGRSDWAAEEFGRLESRSGGEESQEEERWRRLRGAGGLSRRGLAVLKALYEWREEKAAAVNRPARTVVRDDLLVELARLGAGRPSDLSVVRGLPARDLQAIAAVMDEAARTPLEECPSQAERGQDPPQLAVVANVLIAVLNDVCTRDKLAVGLVASNNDVRLIVRSRLLGGPLPACPLTEGWRSRHVLPQLLDILEGRRYVRITNPHTGAPLGYGE
jgi:ribonuclease D